METSLKTQTPKSIFLSKKTERIITALYMVTDLMSDKEPLKWEVRENGVYLLKIQNHIGDTGIHEVVRKLISLLHIGYQAQLISEMNKEVVSTKLMELITDMSTDSREILLKESFFDTKDHTAYVQDNKRQETQEGESEKQLPSQNKEYKTKRHLKIKDTHVRKNAPIDTSSLSDDVLKRRGNIIQVLKRKQPLSVGDIHTHVRGISEKTLQRDLAALEKEGVVARHGKRRWTRYSLV